MELSLDVVATLAIVIFIASTVNGVAGFGFALVAVAALAVVLEPRPAVVLISLITPLLQVFQLRYHWEYRSVAGRLVPMLIAGLVGTVVGSSLLVVLPGFVLAIALGLFAIWYVIGSLRKSPMRVTERTERRIAPAVGGLAGISNGALGASGPILGSYLLAIGLTGRSFVFGISLTFATMSVIRVVTLAVLGEYTMPILLTGLVLIVPAWLGQRLGFMLQGRLSPKAFQRVILVALLAVSVNLLYRGITEGFGVLP